MAEFKYEDAPTSPVYNAGVLRVPGLSVDGHDSYGAIPTLWADLLPNKDIIGGQVATGFVATLGQPIKQGATPGVYVLADETNATGLLLMSTDAYDAPRAINVVKGGNVNCEVGALKALSAAKRGTLATTLGGKYDADTKTLKF